MNVVREIQKINEEELKLGLSEESSWHYQYRSSAWIYVGGLSLDLTEGDVLCVFSQFGEVDDIHLVRDEETGRSKGFAFLKYEDARSAVLAVDNLNGVQVLGRVLRVDHKLDYKPPKEKDEKGDGDAAQAAAEGATGPRNHESGHAYKDKALATEFDISKGVNLFVRPPAAAAATVAADRPIGPVVPSEHRSGRLVSLSSRSASPVPDVPLDKYRDEVEKKQYRSSRRRDRSDSGDSGGRGRGWDRHRRHGDDDGAGDRRGSSRRSRSRSDSRDARRRAQHDRRRRSSSRSRSRDRHRYKSDGRRRSRSNDGARRSRSPDRRRDGGGSNWPASDDRRPLPPPSRPAPAPASSAPAKPGWTGAGSSSGSGAHAGGAAASTGARPPPAGGGAGGDASGAMSWRGKRDPNYKPGGAAQGSGAFGGSGNRPGGFGNNSSSGARPGGAGASGDRRAGDSGFLATFAGAGRLR